tara:strand:- start:6500 stop:7402 length:903 start_codon:yes stop_codon:yes gene_type:complete
MSKFDKSMFDRIKGALSKDSGSGGQFADIIKFPAGHTYVLRILPCVEEGQEALFHHWVNSWESKATGSYTSALSLRTFKENDPISNLRWKQWKAWKEANPKADNKEYQGDLSEKEQWLVNVRVLDNPAKPEENGTTKIFRFGPQIKEIIDTATEGARKDELGWEIFDPTAGFDLKIVAEKQGVYTTYKNSFFTSKTDTVFKDGEIEEIYENLHDLNQVYPVKTYEELEGLLADHYYCGAATGAATEAPERKALPQKEVEPEEEIPMDFPATDVVEKAATPAKSSAVAGDVDELLEGLDLD